MQYHSDWKPCKETLTQAVVWTSINNLNVFKSFQLMLAPPSKLLSNAIKFTHIHTCSFRIVVLELTKLLPCGWV